ncbi:hypothetical protein BC829DRAFT_360019, partial [Chytridium lagenaria]
TDVNCYVPRCISDTVMQMVRVTSLSDLDSLPVKRWESLSPLWMSRAKMHLTVEGLDIVIMPGLAFDRTRARIGYGRGYYDRFLQQCRDKSVRNGKAFTTIALSLPDQLVDSVPMDERDLRPDMVLTPDEVLS